MRTIHRAASKGKPKARKKVRSFQPPCPLAGAMRRVEKVVNEHFPEALNPLKAALAVAAVGCIKDNEQPTTLIFVAGPGAGKTLALSFLTPSDANDPLAQYCYRSDRFTTASFVSHKADVQADELARIDLLPKIKNKTLITKELAPLFRGKQSDLMATFAMLTTILDGYGYVGDSGAHGQRGYSEPVNFQWLGATTQPSEEVLTVIADVGPRMVFYNADRPEKTVDELVALAGKSNEDEGKGECTRAVHELLLLLYKISPPSSVVSESVRIAEGQRRLLVLWAKVLVALRVRLQEPQRAEPQREHPERVLGILRNLAVGSALIHGRREVTDYDLGQVAHIAVSSGVPGRQRVFRAVVENGGRATTPEVEKLAKVTAPTARKHMKELEMVGLARFVTGNQGVPATVELVAPYSELCAAPRLR